MAEEQSGEGKHAAEGRIIDGVLAVLENAKRDGMALNDASLFAAKVIFNQVRDTFGAEEAYRQIQVLALRYAPTSQGETSSVN